MKFFQGGDLRKQFLTKIAEALYTQAPNQRERDDLLGTITGAHMHHLPEGLQKKSSGLSEAITDEHRWMIPVIAQCQQTWKQTNHTLPFDLLKAESGKYLQDLMETIGEVERRQISGGERK